MTRLSILALAALTCLSAPAFAQADSSPLRPGDVDASALAPYSYQYRIHVTAPVQQVFGTATETMTIEDGVSLTVTAVNGQGMQQTDSVSVAWPTLAPIRQTSNANSGRKAYDFTPNAVSGVTRTGSALDVMLEEPVFGPGAADLIARAMLLEEGATAQYVSFDDDTPDAPKTTTLTTTGQAEVLGRTAWIVTADDGGDVRTFAFDAETGETLRVAFSPQPGVMIELRRMDLDSE